MILRPYQSAAVANVLADPTTRPCLVAPTGSGKTVMGVAVAERMQRRTLWIAHRRELIHQAAAKLPGAGLILAGEKPSDAMIQVASIQTYIRRDPLADVGLVVIDEAHHVRAESYQSLRVQHPDACFLGLTATPFRLDGRGLGTFFGRLVVAATTKQLCDDGTLAKPRVFSHPPPDLKGVRVAHGEYDAAGLAEKLNTQEHIGDMVKTWQDRANGGRTVIYAVTIEHSRAICAAFAAAGIAAEHVDGDTPYEERADILARLRDGATRVVSNCMVLTEGWDLPALEVCVLARPTKSLNLYLQMIGRVMRRTEGKPGAIIIDHSGNYDEHGPPLQTLEYSLDDDRRVKRAPNDDVEKTWTCPRCRCVNSLEATRCVECGEENPAFARERDAGVKVGVIHGEGDLVERDDEERVRYVTVHGRVIRADKVPTADREVVFRSLLAQADQRGYKRGWAAYRYKDLFGVWPSNRFSRTVTRSPADAAPF